MPLLVAFCALIGLVIGSFLNVVIYRVPARLSVVSPPSACPQCDNPIRNRDNIPVLGWLLLRGKCRDCSLPISPRYPLVELGTGALFAVLAARFGFDAALPAFLYFAAAGIALAMIDVDTKRLPDVLTLPSWGVTAVLLGAAALAQGDGHAALRALLGAVVVGGLYFLLWFAYPSGMGFGDVKLAPVVGAYLGWISWKAVAVGVFSGFLTGGLVGILFVLFASGGRKTKIPFGPFMLIGALIGILVGIDVADWYLSATTG